MEAQIKPSEAQIKQTIIDLRKRLNEPEMSKPVNRAVKEGFEESINILVEGRDTYDGIDALRTQQGRAIAVLAVDFLKGDCEKHILLGVPVKE